MNARLVQEIADAILYEGYILYPYRPSALKNRRRFTFGVLSPRADCEASGNGAEDWFTQTECLARVTPETRLDVRVRFLQLVERAVGDAQPPWQEGTPCDVHFSTSIADTLATPLEHAFHRPARIAHEQPADARHHGRGPLRTQAAIDGRVRLSLARVDDDLVRVTLHISNITEPAPSTAARGNEQEHERGRATLLRSLVSTHAILHLEGGQFLSMMDPPEPARDAAAACRNVGTWPVLVGEAPGADAMLSSPIILYDYPQIAPESPGALFDGTEIDEILALRILTMTDEEKREMRESDARGREILERTERLSPEDWLQMHGIMREPRALEGRRR